MQTPAARRHHGSIQNKTTRHSEQSEAAFQKATRRTSSAPVSPLRPRSCCDSPRKYLPQGSPPSPPRPGTHQNRHRQAHHRRRRRRRQAPTASPARSRDEGAASPQNAALLERSSRSPRPTPPNLPRHGPPLHRRRLLTPSCAATMFPVAASQRGRVALWTVLPRSARIAPGAAAGVAIPMLLLCGHIHRLLHRRRGEVSPAPPSPALPAPPLPSLQAAVGAFLRALLATGHLRRVISRLRLPERFPLVSRPERSATTPISRLLPLPPPPPPPPPPRTRPSAGSGGVGTGGVSAPSSLRRRGRGRATARARARARARRRTPAAAPPRSCGC